MFTGKFEDDKNSAIATEGDVIGPSPSVSQKSSKTGDDLGHSKPQKSNEVESDDEEDMIGPPLPPGLTKGSKTSEEEVEIGPPLPPTSASKGSDDEDDEPEEVRIVTRLIKFRMHVWMKMLKNLFIFFSFFKN